MSKAIIVLQIQVCVIELEASEALLVRFVNVKIETVSGKCCNLHSPSRTLSLSLSFLNTNGSMPSHELCELSNDARVELYLSLFVAPILTHDYLLRTSKFEE